MRGKDVALENLVTFALVICALGKGYPSTGLMPRKRIGTFAMDSLWIKCANHHLLLSTAIRFEMAGNWPIDDFESKHENPPKNQIVFYGDSDIDFWDLEESFPGLTALKCGVAGCTMEHIQQYGDRFLEKYCPAV